MATMLAVIECPDAMTETQLTELRRRAEKELGQEFRVLILSGGLKCTVSPIPATPAKAD